MNTNHRITWTMATVTAACLVLFFGSAHAVTISSSAARVQVNQPVAFTITVQPPATVGLNCPVVVDFGEGQGFQDVGTLNNSTVMVVSHTFSSAGTYTVQARKGNGCNAVGAPSAQVTVTVSDPAPPGRISIEANPNNADVNQPVAFVISVQVSSNAACPVIVDYGDGSAPETVGQVTADTVINTTHRFASPGTYAVTVRSTAGCPALASAQDTVTVRVTQPVGSIGIQAVNSPVEINETARFRIQVRLTSSVSCPVIVDYGDGSPEQLLSSVDRNANLTAAHNYADAGQYTVTVKSSTGCPALAGVQGTTTVRVTQPLGSLTVQALTGQAFVNEEIGFRIQVQLTSSVACPVVIDYGDGSPEQHLSAVTQDAVLTASHRYTRAGQYTVTVRSSTGCPALANARDTTSVRIIQPAGNLNIRAQVSQGRVDDPIGFVVSVVMDAGPACPVYIDYGDGTPVQTVSTVTGSRVINTTHPFSRSGTYTVSVYSDASCAALASARSSVPVTVLEAPVQRRGLVISRLEIYFDNQRPEITVERNAPSPGLSVKINYSGAGYLKGFWEVDGNRRHHVSEPLGAGFQKIFRYPDVPPLPTYTPGTHRVRFVITEPVMNSDFPIGIYFVTAREAAEEIRLYQPADNEKLPFEPVHFRWRETGSTALYYIRILAADSGQEQVIFSAYTNKGAYDVRPEVIKFRMQPGAEYFWDVQGFDRDRRMAAKSRLQRFVFNEDAEMIPGQILIITEKGAGDAVITAAQKEYGLDILDSFDLLSIGVTVTQVVTDQDIQLIIDALKNRDGVIAVQPNYIFTTLAEPLNDLQTIRRIIDVESLNAVATGKGVRVAVVDTGVDAGHPDLAKAVTDQKNCLKTSEFRPEIHGTAVAGLIASRHNGTGISGLAPEVGIFSLRACEQVSESSPLGRCYSASMALALDEAIMGGVQIVNMSLGTPAEDGLIARLIDAGAGKGILFVAPVGNNPLAARISFPASHPRVLAVAGENEDHSLFPNGPVARAADLYLPCENIFSTQPGGTHNFLTGTSLSSAMVSGILALAVEKNRFLTKETLPRFDGNLKHWLTRLF